MTKKNEPANPVRKYIHLTLFALLCMAGMYWSFVQGRVKYIEARNLRTLGSISDSISLKIESLEGPVVETVQKTTDQKKVNDTSGDVTGKSIEADLRKQLKKIKLIDWAESQIYVAKVDRNKDRVEKLEKPKSDGEKADKSTDESPDLSANQTWLNLTYSHDFNLSGAPYQVRLNLAVDKDGFFEDLIYREMFDHLLVVKHPSNPTLAGEIIFQHNRDESRLHEIMELKQADGNPWKFSKETMQSAMARVNLANKTYTLFSQPVKIRPLSGGDGGKQAPWVVMGLVESSDLRGESMAFSSSVGITALFVLLGGIFLLPTIRLKYMHVFDEMNMHETYTIFLTLFLFVFLTTLAIVDLFIYMYLRSHATANMEKVADNIRNRFNHELKQVLVQLDTLDQEKARYYGNDGRESHQVINFLDVMREGGYLSTNSEEMAYPFFKMVTWTDASGAEKYRWKTKSTISPMVSVGSQPFFQNIKRRKDWHISFEGDAPQDGSSQTGSSQTGSSQTGASKDGSSQTGSSPAGFSYQCIIQPAHSKTTGNFEVAVSIRSRENGVAERSDIFHGAATMSTRFQCLDSPVLPPGMGFALINKDGDVLLHSDKRRNLKENLFIECEEDSNLKSIVWSNVSNSLRVNYMGVPHLFHVSPLKAGIPWTLAVFQTKDSLSSYNLIILTQTAIIFMVYLLVLFLAAVTISFFFRRDRYNLRRGWLWPQDNKTSTYMEMCGVYLALALANLLNLIPGVDETTILANIFYCGLLLVFFTFMKLGYSAGMPRKVKFAAGAGVSLFLTLVIGIHARLLGSEFEPFHLLYPIVALPVVGFLGPVLRNRPFKIHYSKAYTLMIFTMTLALVLTPVVALCRLSFEFEGRLMTRYHQLELLKALHARDRMIFTKNIKDLERVRKNLHKDENLARLLKMPLTNNQTREPALERVLEEKAFLKPSGSFTGFGWDDYLDIYPESYFIGGIHETPEKPDNAKEGATISIKNMMAWLIPVFNDITLAQRYLFDDETGKRTFYWRQDHQLSLLETQPNMRGEYYVIHTSKHSLSDVFSIASYLLVIVIFILPVLLMVLYRIIFLIVEKLFLLDLTPVDWWSHVDLKQLLSENGSEGGPLSHYLFLGSTFPDEFMPTKTFQPAYRVIDFRKMDGVTDPDWPDTIAKSLTTGTTPLVFAYFDYVHARHIEMRPLVASRKYRLLERLLAESNRRIIIFSEYDPAFYFNIDDNNDLGLKKDPETHLWDTQDMPTSMYWSSLMKSFSILPFRDRPVSQESTRGEYLVARILNWECARWPELVSLLPPKSRQKNWEKLKPEQIFRELKEIFKRHYYYTWARCTRSERWLLYDLARDGFVNPSNKRTLNYLVKKRLIVHNRTYQLVSESFRLFVLEAFQDSDRPDLAEGSMTWNMLRAPLLMVLLGGSAFLFLTQQELMELYTTLASTIALGAIPLVLKSLGFMKSS